MKETTVESIKCHARIVLPANATVGKPCMTQGTKVMVGETQLSGVYSIELHAGINDVWRAVIHCHADVPAVECDAVVHRTRKPWLARALAWINGEPQDTTSFSSTSREWA